MQLAVGCRQMLKEKRYAVPPVKPELAGDFFTILITFTMEAAESQAYDPQGEPHCCNCVCEPYGVAHFSGKLMVNQEPARSRSKADMQWTCIKAATMSAISSRGAAA